MLKPLRPLLTDRRRGRAVAAASVTLAAAGIVLLRAPKPSQGLPLAPVNGVARVQPSRSAQGAAQVRFATGAVHGRVAMAQGAVGPDVPSHVYTELRITADDAPGSVAPRPVAMAVVLDVSGSMSGEKLEQARGSVLSLVDQMRDDDRIALVTYSDNARIVQPLARVADVRQRLHGIVPGITIEGGTNIPAGLAAGASTLETAPPTFVQRVVLVSDGQDTSGQPLDRTAASVRTRAEQGVTLSALGVGADYDERFMSRVADAGRGNYEFLRNGAQLRAFLSRELQQATRTVVERAYVNLTLPEGWRLARGYGSEVAAFGRSVNVPVGALFAGEERRLVLDLVVDPAQAQRAHGDGHAGAVVARLGYHDVRSNAPSTHDLGALAMGVARSDADALASRDVVVFAEAEGTVIAARQADAVVAWRTGNAGEAASIAQQNLHALRALQAAAPSPARAAQIRAYDEDNTAFNTVSGASEEGRAYGLRSNAVHRRAQRSAAAY
jgi:Ca-activated chloride channel family protein